MSKHIYLITIVMSLAFGLARAPAYSAGWAGFVESPQTSANLSFAAMKGSSGGNGAGYSCEGLVCTCQGDDDCNDMFGSGKCGDPATCDKTTGICKCFIFKKKPKGKHLPGKAPLSNTLQ